MTGEIKVISGTAHPELARDICEHLGIDVVPLHRRALLEREHAGADRRERARGRRLRDPAVVPAGLGRHPRAAHHDRRAEARVGRAHHRGAAVLPVRALRQEGPPAHLDHGAADGGPARDRGRRPRAHAWTCTRRRCRASSASRPTSCRRRRSCATTCARAATSPDYVLVAGDVGESKEVGHYAKRLNLPIAIVDKRRDGDDERARAVNLIGDVRGKDALIVDDEVASGGTLIEAARFVLDRGATAVEACIVHPCCRPARSSGSTSRRCASSWSPTRSRSRREAQRQDPGRPVAPLFARRDPRDPRRLERLEAVPLAALQPARLEDLRHDRRVHRGQLREEASSR